MFAQHNVQTVSPLARLHLLLFMTRYELKKREITTKEKIGACWKGQKASKANAQSHRHRTQLWFGARHLTKGWEQRQGSTPLCEVSHFCPQGAAVCRQMHLIGLDDLKGLFLDGSMIPWAHLSLSMHSDIQQWRTAAEKQVHSPTSERGVTATQPCKICPENELVPGFPRGGSRQWGHWSRKLPWQWED